MMLKWGNCCYHAEVASLCLGNLMVGYHYGRRAWAARRTHRSEAHATNLLCHNYQQAVLPAMWNTAHIKSLKCAPSLLGPEFLCPRKLSKLWDIQKGSMMTQASYIWHQPTLLKTLCVISRLLSYIQLLKIKPVYGHSGHAPLSFRKVQGQAVYAVDRDDEEIDFETVLREDPVPIPWAALYTGASHFNPRPEARTRFIYM